MRVLQGKIQQEQLPQSLPASLAVQGNQPGFAGLHSVQSPDAVVVSVENKLARFAEATPVFGKNIFAELPTLSPDRIDTPQKKRWMMKEHDGKPFFTG